VEWWSIGVMGWLSLTSSPSSRREAERDDVSEDCIGGNLPQDGELRRAVGRFSTIKPGSIYVTRNVAPQAGVIPSVAEGPHLLA